MRQRRVRDVKQRLHVERDHAIPLVGRGLQRGAKQGVITSSAAERKISRLSARIKSLKG